MKKTVTKVLTIVMVGSTLSITGHAASSADIDCYVKAIRDEKVKIYDQERYRLPQILECGLASSVGGVLGLMLSPQLVAYGYILGAAGGIGNRLAEDMLIRKRLDSLENARWLLSIGRSDDSYDKLLKEIQRDVPSFTADDLDAVLVRMNRDQVGQTNYLPGFEEIRVTARMLAKSGYNAQMLSELDANHPAAAQVK